MNGFLIIDKPKGITSAQCVYKLRSKLGTKKIGHCGTLDPIATGLLPVCIGEATKYSNYASNLDKVYEVGIEFGVETDTGDITGKIVSKTQFNGFKEKFDKSLIELEGVHDQIPPMYSAIKINGNPLYYWARKGVSLYRKPRKIEIKSIELLDQSNNTAILKVFCSKGTYIRTLVETLGRNLGYLATMTYLRRLKVGEMCLDRQTCDFNDTNESISKKILPCDAMLGQMDKIAINIEDTKKVRNGLSIDYNAPLKNKRLVRIYTDTELFVGIGEIDENSKVLPKRLLSTN